MEFKYHVMTIYASDPERLQRLENILNNGWEIVNVTAEHVATGDSFREGLIVYVLRKETLEGMK